MAEFDEIYALYFSDVYKYALSLSGNEAVAEDITQETFYKAIKSIDSFRGNCKIRVWLCQIAKNTYFTHYAREKQKTARSDKLEPTDTGNVERRLLSDETSFEIHNALHRMDEPYREVFYLRLFCELSFAKIAELFNKTESWARVTYHRAKIKLKEDLT